MERTFWFPDFESEGGDFVVLYTKRRPQREENQDKSKSYFFYWNLDVLIWITKVPLFLPNLPKWTTVNPPK